MNEADPLEEREEQTERVKERQLLEQFARSREVTELTALLGGEPMRDFLWRVLSRCNVFKSTWDSNYGRMSLNEGARQVGLWLLTEISEAAPDALLAMQLKSSRQAQSAAAEERRVQEQRTRPS